jgi:hypothetical protein
MVCPSDDGDLQRQTSGGLFALGNYLAFFGDIAHDNCIEPEVPLSKDPPSARHAFGINFGAAMRHFVDGSSNTMVLGEYRRGIAGEERDWRGLYYQDEASNSQLYTQFTPNASSPDTIWSGYCINRPQAGLPCIDGYNETAASRSAHPDGVHVAMGDGSAKFISDDISIRIWRAMGTIQGEEVLEIP